MDEEGSVSFLHPCYHLADRVGAGSSLLSCHEFGLTCFPDHRVGSSVLPKRGTHLWTGEWLSCPSMGVPWGTQPAYLLQYTRRGRTSHCRVRNSTPHTVIGSSPNQVATLASGGYWCHPDCYSPGGNAVLDTNVACPQALTGATDINSHLVSCSRALDHIPFLTSPWTQVTSWPFMSAVSHHPHPSWSAFLPSPQKAASSPFLLPPQPRALELCHQKWNVMC